MLALHRRIARLERERHSATAQQRRDSIAAYALVLDRSFELLTDDEQALLLDAMNVAAAGGVQAEAHIAVRNRYLDAAAPLQRQIDQARARALAACGGDVGALGKAMNCS